MESQYADDPEESFSTSLTPEQVREEFAEGLPMHVIAEWLSTAQNVETARSDSGNWVYYVVDGIRLDLFVDDANSPLIQQAHTVRMMHRLGNKITGISEYSRV